MNVKRKDRHIEFKEVPSGAVFEAEGGIYMKCYDIDRPKGTCEFFGVNIETGKMVLFIDDRSVTLLNMEVVEV